MEPSDLQKLFRARDVNRSGKIEPDDFTAVCRELGAAESEIRTLFAEFDADDDGCVDYGSFSARFRQVWRVRGGDAERVLSPSLSQQLADLHRTLEACAQPLLLQRYERVVSSLVGQSLDNGLRRERLEAALRRAGDMSGGRLAQLEDDMQKQLAGTEQRAREEERKSMEEVLRNLQRKHQDQIADLQATVDRLLQSQAESRSPRSKEERLDVSRHVGQLSQENEQLRSSLLEARSDVGALRSELDKLKDMYADERAQRERETNQLKKMVIEYESYSSQVQILQDLNKQLCDSNEGLRSALASEVKRKVPAKNEAPARRTKPVRQSTLKHNSSSMSNVSLWADKYLDSGVSLPPDASDSSASELDTDLDTDDGRGSSETVHRSYSCAHSDGELLDTKSEAGLSLAQSLGSSNASSMRKQLSAFAKEAAEAEAAPADDAVPMYRLVLAGDAGAGKSSFLLRLALNQFKADIQTTLGVDFQIKKMLVDGQKTNLQIWDTAGQVPQYRPLLFPQSSRRSALVRRDFGEQLPQHPRLAGSDPGRHRGRGSRLHHRQQGGHEKPDARQTLRQHFARREVGHGVRRLVLRNQCQRRDQRGGGGAPSGQRSEEEGESETQNVSGGPFGHKCQEDFWHMLPPVDALWNPNFFFFCLSLWPGKTTCPNMLSIFVFIGL